MKVTDSDGISAFPSPHSGILFLLKAVALGDGRYAVLGFRPLIRGFFFYHRGNKRIRHTVVQVSVPSFGDSFFIRRRKNETNYVQIVSVPSFGDSFFIRTLPEGARTRSISFRPLIRGFFFYHIPVNFVCAWAHSFRPLIRGFFFYKLYSQTNRYSGSQRFPSPHSGILFL